MKSEFSTCAKRRGLLAIIALIAVIGFMALPLTGCSDPEPDVTLTKIEITEQPTKKVYTVGDTLNTAGLVVTATYSDNTTKNVTADCEFSSFDSTTAGEKTITVTFQDQTTSFKVTVNNRPSVAMPTATPVAGTYIGEQHVTLGSTTEGATIYYTTDGTTTPTASSTLYSTAISISSTTTLKAIAIKDDFNDSDILTATYTISTPINMPTADTWVDGNLSSTTAMEQWFKFTSTATTQYIHFQAGTLSSVNMQVYNADGITTVGSTTTFGTSTVYTSRTLTNNTVYYIKITGVFSGSYKIAFNTTSSSPTTVTIPTTGVTDLTSGKWSDSSIPTAGGEQWFKLTTAASGTSMYIHFLPGSLAGANVQMYTNEGRVSGSSTSFTISSTLYSSRTVTASTVYYIKVTPSSSTYTGTFRIGFNTSYSSTPSITIPTTGVTTLTTAETWYDGTLTAGGEQWFTFTATTTTQYIHFLPGTLTRADIQLYDSTGAPVSIRSSLGGGTFSVSRTTSLSGVYYILVLPYSSTINAGAYKLAFGTTSTQPAITLPSGTIPTLVADTWKDGSITTAGSDEWFKFTSTATTQYIHFQPGTLSSVYVRVYKSDGTTAGSMPNLDITAPTTSQTVTASTEYFIRVTPYSTSDTGAYKIAFNSTQATPVTTTVPTASASTLTLDKFYDSEILTAGGEQWFKFTATASYQYIHFSMGNLTSVYIQLYTSDGRLFYGRANLYNYNLYTYRYTTSGTDYYIKVTPATSTGKGTYKIGFNTASSPTPSITLPTSNVTELTNINTWYDGNITTSTGEQWFKFTATSTSHYIHFKTGTLNDVYVQLYNSDGTTNGSRINLYGSTLYTQRTGLTINSVYYIRVWPYSSSGAYQLAFATSSTAPTN